MEKLGNSSWITLSTTNTNQSFCFPGKGHTLECTWEILALYDGGSSKIDFQFFHDVRILDYTSTFSTSNITVILVSKKKYPPSFSTEHKKKISKNSFSPRSACYVRIGELRNDWNLQQKKKKTLQISSKSKLVPTNTDTSSMANLWNCTRSGNSNWIVNWISNNCKKQLKSRWIRSAYSRLGGKLSRFFPRSLELGLPCWVHDVARAN